MKAKIILLSVFLAFQTNVFSQSEVDKYQQEIQKMVNSEKQKMNAELSQLEEQYRQNKMTEAEFQTQKKSIAQKYEAIINEKIDEKSSQFQDATKEIALKSIFSKGDDDKNENDKGKSIKLSIFEKNSKKDSLNKALNPEKYLRGKDVYWSYAFLNLAKESDSFNPFEADSKMRIGNSHSFEYRLVFQEQLGDKKSPFFINYGVSYRADTYMPQRQLVVNQNDALQQIELVDFTQGKLKRSKLRTTYLTLPLEFQWVVNPKYRTYEGKTYIDGTAKQLRISAGIYAGVNLRSIVKVKYYDDNEKFDKYKYTLDYGVNRFLFGVKFGVRYSGINLYIKKDLTPIFNNQSQFPYKNAIHLGIDIGKLQFK